MSLMQGEDAVEAVNSKIERVNKKFQEEAN